MFKAHNSNIRKICEMCSKLKINTPVFTVSKKTGVLVSLLLALNIFLHLEQVLFFKKKEHLTI